MSAIDTSIPSALAASLTGATQRTLTIRPITEADATRPDRTRRDDQPAAASATPGAPAPQADTAEISPEARDANAAAASAERSADGDPLTAEERQQLDDLRARDREVRAHEQAHVAAAGPLFRGGPYYDFQTGPDGKRYAVGGRVSIDTSPGRTPEETIRRAQQAQRAALAPAEPSSTDRAVAARAARQEAEARAELAASDDAPTDTPGAARPEPNAVGPDRDDPGALEPSDESDRRADTAETTAEAAAAAAPADRFARAYGATSAASNTLAAGLDVTA